MPASTPADRQRLLVRRVTEHRARDDGARFVGTDGARRGEVVYRDRVLTLALPSGGADGATGPTGDGADAAETALDGVLDAFPAFRRKQPETRKAPRGTVYVSALADPKRLADFVEAALREVYGLDEGYELVAEPLATE